MWVYARHICGKWYEQATVECVTNGHDTASKIRVPSTCTVDAIDSNSGDTSDGQAVSTTPSLACLPRLYWAKPTEHNRHTNRLFRVIDTGAACRLSCGQLNSVLALGYRLFSGRCRCTSPTRMGIFRQTVDQSHSVETAAASQQV